MPKAPFFLAVHDSDTGNYTIEGPMTDDTAWNDAVVVAQQAGGSVNCSTSSEATNRAMAQAEAAQSFSGEELPPGSIVQV